MTWPLHEHGRALDFVGSAGNHRAAMDEAVARGAAHNAALAAAATPLPTKWGSPRFPLSNETMRTHLHIDLRPDSDLTPDELADRQARRAAYEAKVAAREPFAAAALAHWRRLAESTDTVGKIAALHSPDDEDRPRSPHARMYCAGCPTDSYAMDAPEWPCDTATLIAAESGISLDVLTDHGWPRSPDADHDDQESDQ